MDSLPSLSPRLSLFRTFLGLLLCLALSAPLMCLAEEGQIDPDLDGMSLPSDRTNVRGIRRVRESIDRGEYSQVVRFLDEVLSRPEDSFLLERSAGKYVGLKSTVLDILRDLPEEGRIIYEATFEPVAKRLLKKAVQEGKLDDIRAISQRYFHTPSGYEATMLLAKHEADIGKHLSAALIYEKLAQTSQATYQLEPQISIQATLNWLAIGKRERAERALLRISSSNQLVQIEDIPLSFLNTDGEPLEKLLSMTGLPEIAGDSGKEQWLNIHGNAQRNRQSQGSLPHLRVDWNVRLLGHPSLNSIYEEILLARRERERSLVPVGMPIAVGDYLITRSAHNLIAIDFRTGKRVWQAQSQRFTPFENLINGNREQENAAELEPSQAFAQRIWDDSLFSTISSDGEKVFAIRDLEPARTGRYRIEMQLFGQGSRQISNAATNRLCAYDLATQGKLIWEVDGASSRDQLAGSFFLGAPLTVGKSLYCLIERYNEKAIYLVCLDRAKGKLLWQQQLVNLEDGILEDFSRRMESSSPSFDDGVLVCPTGAGVVIGVDLMQNTLSWAYHYKANRQPVQMGRSSRSRYRSNSNYDRWIDPTVRISNNHVLLSPSESNSLHCLDLKTGELLWKQELQKGLFVAGVHNEIVLVVEQDGIRRLRLKDGASPKEGGYFQEFPDKSSPSGQGFLSNGNYYLPLSNGQIIVADIGKGSIVDRATSRDGKSLGNLICHRGTVISQNGQSLERFGQIDVLQKQSHEKLKKNPFDHVALRTLGEMAYNSGELPEAIDLLYSAYLSAPEDLQTRDVLSDCLQEALDEDFGQFREHLALLEELQSPGGKNHLTVLRLKAQGYLEIGEILKAFDMCEKMFEGGSQSYSLLEIGRHRQVALPRWVSAQVLAIWEKSNALQRQEIKNRIESGIEDILRNEDHLQATRYLDCFGSLPACEPLALSVGIEEFNRGNNLASQQILLRLCNSSDRNIAATAVAMNSTLLHKAGLHQLAVSFDKRLSTEFAQVLCLDGKTGIECLAPWSETESVGALSWPSGALAISQSQPTRQRDRVSTRPMHVEVQLDRCDDVLAGCNVLLGHGNREFVVRNPIGKDIFKMSVGQRNAIPMYGMGLTYGVSRGNLLLVSSGHQYMALDTLSNAESGVPKPLWKKQSLNNFDNRMIHFRGLNPRQSALRPGSRRAPRVESEGKWVGVIGPVTHNSCVIQNQTRLACLNPISGELRWLRTDVPAGCDLFGDEEVTFAVERNKATALMFSTNDGRVLGKVDVPLWHERVTTFGRHIVTWKNANGHKKELACIDGLTQEEKWNYAFDGSSKLDIARGRYIAVVDAKGHCVIVDIENGDFLVEQSITRVVRIDSVHLIAGTDHFTIAVQTPMGTRAPAPRVIDVNKYDFPVFDGHLYVFRRSDGQPSFPGPATVKQHGLMLSHPVDLPVLPFVSSQHIQTNRNRTNTMRFMMLEKSSGRLLYLNENLPTSRNHFEVRMSGSKPKELIVEMMTSNLSFEFTDNPRPVEPPYRQELYSKGSKGILGIAEGIFE